MNFLWYDKEELGNLTFLGDTNHIEIAVFRDDKPTHIKHMTKKMLKRVGVKVSCI